MIMDNDNGQARGERHFPKLFVMDLDGTALGGGKPYKRFPDELSAFLDGLVRNGCAWTTNTTWEVMPQLQLLYASRVASRPPYLTGGSGLQLCALEGDRPVPVEPYSSTMASRMKEVVRAHLLPLLREAGRSLTPEKIGFNGFWLAMTVVPEDAERLARFVEERRLAAARELHIAYVPEEHRFYAHPAFLKKGTVLRELVRLTGCGPEDIVVAGDEKMDLDMMRPELAAHAICPANADPEVKRHVLAMGGAVGDVPYGLGIVQAFGKLAKARGWRGEEAFV